MDLIERKKALLMAQDQFVPPGYQKVDFVAGDGSAYINSGIECTSDLTVDFMFSVSTVVNAALCGGIKLTSPIFRHHSSPYASSTVVSMYHYMNNEERLIPITIASPSINTKYHILLDATYGRYLFEGENYYESGEFTPIEGKTTGKNYGILGRIAQNDAVQSRPSKIYYFKFFKNSKMIGNFIPCYRKSDNVAGMYDTITNQFFTNAGSGTITAGND